MGHIKRVYIYYNHNGVDIAFAFDEGFRGRIQGPDHSGLLCSVIDNKEESTIAYITEPFEGREVLRIILSK